MMSLPAGWVEATIPELMQADGTFVDGDWVESKDQDPNGNVRLIQLADVGDARYTSKSARFLTNAKAVELRCTYLRSGDILVARMPDPLGRACIFPGDPKPSVTVVDVCIIRTGTDGADHRWLMWAINSPQFRMKIDALQSGTTRKRISRGNLATISLPIPPLEEQRRIVDALEEYLSDLDAAVAGLERARTNVRRFVDSSIATHANPRADWPLVPLRELGMLKGGVTKGQKRRPGEVTRNVPYLRVANVQRGRLDLRDMRTIEATEREIRELRLQPGDVLFNEGGDRDKLGRGWVWNGELEECIHQNHVFRARLDTSRVEPRFVSHYANSHGQRYFLDQGKQTTNLASISMTKLGALPVPVPPLDYQKALVFEIEERLSVAERTAADIDVQLARAARLRQAILHRAFTGRLVAQNPADEPASVLLGRLRATTNPRTTAAPGARRQPRTTPSH